MNDPAAVIWKFTGDDAVPRGTVTLAGDGLLSVKSTTCMVSGIWCVTLFGSVPTPCRLKL